MGFVALARHVHRLKSGAPLVAWLYLVTRRACIDARRAEARRKAREKPEDAGQFIGS